MLFSLSRLLWALSPLKRHSSNLPSFCILSISFAFLSLPRPPVPYLPFAAQPRPETSLVQTCCRVCVHVRIWVCVCVCLHIVLWCISFLKERWVFFCVVLLMCLFCPFCIFPSASLFASALFPFFPWFFSFTICSEICRALLCVRLPERIRCLWASFLFTFQSNFIHYWSKEGFVSHGFPSKPPPAIYWAIKT